MKICIYLLLLLTTSFTLGPGPCLGATSSPDSYGSSNPPFWYPLTSFEQETLALAEEARWGNQEVLLRLALMAAGVRNSYTFQGYRKKITEFLAKTGPELNRLKDPLHRGRLLHEKMHLHFMKSATKNAQPPGYDLDQSSLRVLLDSGKYNCTSSAILYIILAGHFDLEVKGALLPTHVFVELSAGKNGNIDVETTNIHGFGKDHNQEFYQKQAAGWESWRGQSPVTYQEYLERQFISPIELVAMNMDDQHVRQGSMDEEDRLRLKEAQSMILTGDKKYQLQRLGLYNNEYNRLSNQDDYQSLVRMYSVIKPVMDDIVGQWPTDSAILEMLSWSYFQQATSHYQTGAGEEALAMMEISLELYLDNPSPEENHRILNNNLVLLSKMVHELLANFAFIDSLNLSDRFSSYFQEEDNFQTMNKVIFNRWTNYYWQRQEWEKVLVLLEEQLALLSPDDSEDTEKLLNQMTGVYLNKGNAALKNKDWQEAIFLYQAGLSWASSNTPARAPEFRQQIAASYQGRAISYFNRQDWSNAIEDFTGQLEWTDETQIRQNTENNLSSAYNNWKNEYVRLDDLSGARAILQECAGRFPDLTLCWEQLLQMENSHPL